MNPLDIAVDLARKAGAIQMAHLGKAHTIDYKGPINIVTEVDAQCEKLIVDGLIAAFPDHGIVAEEGSSRPTKNGYEWIVDPLDGTVNYTHGYPLFGPSIALTYNRKPVLGVVLESNRDELFAAEKGRGATLNGKPIHVSSVGKLEQSLLVTGFAYNIQEGEMQNNIDHFCRFLFKAQASRRDGAAAPDLCYVACGRFDGFWELYLKPWDIAAGSLIVTEAGGRVSAFDGGPFDCFGHEILASNGDIHAAMMAVLAEGVS